MSVSIDEQFIAYIVKSVVGNPDAVQIKRTIDEKGVLLELTVDPEDLGRVIGKRGATAQSLRTLLRALGTKNDARYNLKIVDNGAPRPGREERADEQTESQAAPMPDENPPAEVDIDDNQEETDIDEPGETTEEASVAEVEAEEPVQNDSGRLSHYDRTRKELDDLDDLDI